MALVDNHVEAEAAQQACRKQQREWLLKLPSSSGGRRVAWRLLKRHRVGGYRTMLYTDHQLRMAGLSGLSHFKVNYDETPWNEWPLITLNWDQESGSMSAADFMMYAEGINCDVVWDAGQGAWTDCKGAWTDGNLLGMMLGLLMCWNLPHGPWQDDQRSSQARELIIDIVSSQYSTAPPLLASRASEILEETGRSSEAGDPGIMQRLWNEFRFDSVFERKGSKVSMNRLMSLVAECRKACLNLEQTPTQLQACSALVSSVSQCRRARGVGPRCMCASPKPHEALTSCSRM